MKSKTHKILTIGGGSGQYVLLSGLRDLANIEITSVVSMSDNGGSTGRLRDELGTLPPGDALKCVIALSPFRDVAQKIMLKKLNGNGLFHGHNAGNVLVSMFSQYAGSFPEAINALAKILEAKGTVLPGTVTKHTLVAELTDGTRIYGESAIDIPKSTRREQIKDLFLVPHYNGSISVYPPVIKAIDNSDYILISPGDLFTSIIASLIVPGMKEAIQKTNAKIIYVLNIMTKFGETHNYKAHDFVQTIESYIGRPIDVMICNVKKPNGRLLKKYLKEKAEFVEIDRSGKWLGERVICGEDLIDTSDGTIRHDSKKLASLIRSIIIKLNKNLKRKSAFE